MMNAYLCCVKMKGRDRCGQLNILWNYEVRLPVCVAGVA